MGGWACGMVSPNVKWVRAYTLECFSLPLWSNKIKQNMQNKIKSWRYFASNFWNWKYLHINTRTSMWFVAVIVYMYFIVLYGVLLTCWSFKCCCVNHTLYNTSFAFFICFIMYLTHALQISKWWQNLQPYNNWKVTSLCPWIPDCKNKSWDRMIDSPPHTHTNETSMAPKQHIVTKGACCHLAGWPNGGSHQREVTVWSQQDIKLNPQRVMWRRAPTVARNTHYTTVEAWYMDLKEYI